MLASALTDRQGFSKRIGRTFWALHHRDFRLYWLGQVVSNAGSWMQSIAQAWLVLRLTDSPLALGGVTMLQALPVLLRGRYLGAGDMPAARSVLKAAAYTYVAAALATLLDVARWFRILRF